MSTLATSVQRKGVFAGHKDCLYSLERSLETDVFYSAGGDGMVAKWHIGQPDNGQLLARVPNSIYAIRLIPNKKQLLVAQNFEGIHLIDLITNREIGSLKITKSQIFDIQLYEHLAFIACGDGEIVIVDVENFRVLQSLKPSDKSARCIAINPLVNEFIVGFSDHYIRSFSLLDFGLQHAWLAHANSVFTLAFTSDFQYLVSAGRDARIKIWDTWNHYDLHHDLVAHIYAINSLAFCPNGEKFATGSMDKSVKIWSTAGWKLLKVLDKSRHAGHGTSVNKVLWLDDNQLLSASDDKTVSLWEVSG